MNEQQSLEPTKDPYLDLIREVTGNPELSAEKLKILVDMRLLLEDRESERLFKVAMLAAQKEVVALKWDKVNTEKNSRNVSYPKIEKMLRPIREKYGFVQSYDSEVSPVPDQMTFCCDVTHDGGHTKRYRLPMSISGLGAKGGGVMSGAQAVGNGTSYAMRYLDKMIWNIPMLVDKDDVDGNEPKVLIDKKQAADLRALADESKLTGETSKDVITKMLAYLKVDKLENLPASLYDTAIKGMKNRVNNQ